MEEGKEGVDKDTEVERILVDAFDIKNIKNAGPDFSINELIDIVTYILLFSTPDKEGEDGLYAQYEALKEGLPLAMDNFAASLVPLGMRLNQSILQLQFALKLQLLIARAKVADDILPEENGDLYVVDESLAVRFVDSGQEALWEDHQRKSEQMLDTVSAF